MWFQIKEGSKFIQSCRVPMEELEIIFTFKPSKNWRWEHTICAIERYLGFRLHVRPLERFLPQMRLRRRSARYSHITGQEFESNDLPAASSMLACRTFTRSWSENLPLGPLLRPPNSLLLGSLSMLCSYLKSPWASSCGLSSLIGLPTLGKRLLKNSFIHSSSRFEMVEWKR